MVTKLDQKGEFEKIKKNQESWEKEFLNPIIEEFGEVKKEFKTGSGVFNVKRIYTPLDLKKLDYSQDIGFPGSYPYVRGIYANMYRSQPWSIGEYAGFGTAEESNKRYKYLLEHGQTGGVNIALDLPTQLGYDSDHKMAKGEVGRVGVAIDSLEDVETLFDGIPLDMAKRVFTTANAISPIMLAMLITVAEKQRVDFKKFVVSIQNDILKEFVARSTYIFPPKASLKISTDVIEYCVKNFPHWRSITVCGSHMRQAGANACQEIAFAMANVVEYMKESLKRGISVDKLAPTINLQLVAHNDFFEEIAKFRAVRKLWARVMKEKFKASSPDSYKPRFLVFSAGSTLTAQQPLNNIVRVTMHALAAALGGAQVIYTCSFDEALATPTEEAVMVAMRTLQIINEENNVGNTADPLGGSYYLEHLTDQIAKKAYAIIEEIESKGGAGQAINDGFYQQHIAEGGYRQQKEIENGERVIVGVNKYQIEEEREVNILTVDEEVEKRQLQKLERLKNKRNNSAVKEKLALIKKAAQENKNLVPSTVEAVKEYATIGEICDVLREVYGEYLPEKYYF